MELTFSVSKEQERLLMQDVIYLGISYVIASVKYNHHLVSLSIYI